MLRVIVKDTDGGRACNVGGDVVVSYRTFDIAAPEVEAHLRNQGSYSDSQVVGVELLPAPIADAVAL